MAQTDAQRPSDGYVVVPRHPASNRWPIFIAIGLFLISIVLRLGGIGWGLKNDLHHQSLHPDEELNWRYSQQIEPTKLNFVPHFYSYGTLYLTALRLASDMTAAYTGGPKSVGQDWDFIARCEEAGRLVSTVCGSMIPVILFFAGRRITSDVGATCAGLVAAWSPGIVVHSRFATVDVMNALLVAIVAFYGLRILYEKLETDRTFWRMALLAGVFTGLCAGTKYVGAIAIFMPAVALGIRKPSRWVPMLVSAIGMAGLVFIISTPGVILDTAQFLKDFTFELGHSRAGHGTVFAATASGYLYQIGNMLLGFGPLVFAIALIGLAWGGLRREPWLLVILSFAIPYYLVIGGSEVKFLRYSLPLVIAISAGMGYAIGEGHRKQGTGRLLVAIGILGLGGVDGGELRSSIQFTQAMAGVDPRDEAANYLHRVSNSTTTVGFVEDPWFWSPTLFPDSAMTRMVPFSKRDELRRAAIAPKVLQHVPPDWRDRQAWDLHLLDENPDYIAYSNFESDGLERLAESGRADLGFDEDVTRYKAFQAALKGHYVLDRAFGPGINYVEDMNYVAPTVYIWKRKN